MAKARQVICSANLEECRALAGEICGLKTEQEIIGRLKAFREHHQIDETEGTRACITNR